MQCNPSPPQMYTKVQFYTWDKAQARPITHVTNDRWNTDITFCNAPVFARAFRGTLEYQGPTVHLGQRYLSNTISLLQHPFIRSSIPFVQLNACMRLCFRVCWEPEGPLARQGQKERRWDDSIPNVILHWSSVHTWKICLIQIFPLDQ